MSGGYWEPGFAGVTAQDLFRVFVSRAKQKIEKVYCSGTERATTQTRGAFVEKPLRIKRDHKYTKLDTPPPSDCILRPD